MNKSLFPLLCGIEILALLLTPLAFAEDVHLNELDLSSGGQLIVGPTDTVTIGGVPSPSVGSLPNVNAYQNLPPGFTEGAVTSPTGQLVGPQNFLTQSIGTIPMDQRLLAIPQMQNALGGIDFRPASDLSLNSLVLGPNDRVIMEDGATFTAGSPALANVPGANGAIQATQSSANMGTVMNLETTQSAMTMTQGADGTIQFQ